MFSFSFKGLKLEEEKIYVKSKKVRGGGRNVGWIVHWQKKENLLERKLKLF